MVLLENLKDAEVGKTTRKAATEGDSDAWPSGQFGCAVRSGLRFAYHGESIPIRWWARR